MFRLMHHMQGWGSIHLPSSHQVRPDEGGVGMLHMYTRYRNILNMTSDITVEGTEVPQRS